MEEHASKSVRRKVGSETSKLVSGQHALPRFIHAVTLARVHDERGVLCERALPARKLQSLLKDGQLL